MNRILRIASLLVAIFLMPMFAAAQTNSTNGPANEPAQAKRSRPKLASLWKAAARWVWRISEFCNGSKIITFRSITLRAQHGWPCRRALRDWKEPEGTARACRTTELDIIIGGRTPYEDLSYRRKEDAVIIRL